MSGLVSAILELLFVFQEKNLCQSGQKNICLFNSSIMKQNVVKLLLFLIVPLFCDTFKNTFKKLLNKKFLSRHKHYERVNLFQCFKHCMNNENCDVFNYNTNLQACHLSDSQTDQYLEKIVYSNGWDIYFSTRSAKKEEPNLHELMVFNNELERNNVELDVSIDSSYLTINIHHEKRSIMFLFTVLYRQKSGRISQNKH